jgi:hypothetical protein
MVSEKTNLQIPVLPCAEVTRDFEMMHGIVFIGY